MNWKCKLGFHDWGFSFHPWYKSNGPIPDLKGKSKEELEEVFQEAKQLTKMERRPSGYVPMRICKRCGKVDMKIQLEVFQAMIQSSG